MGKQWFLGAVLALIGFVVQTTDCYAVDQYGWAIRRSAPVDLTGIPYKVVPAGATTIQLPADRVVIVRSATDSANHVLGYYAVVWAHDGSGPSICFISYASLATIGITPTPNWIIVPIDPEPMNMALQRAMYREYVKYAVPTPAGMLKCPPKVAWGYFNLGGNTYVQFCEDYRATWASQQPGTWVTFNPAEIVLNPDTCTDGMPGYAPCPVDP